MKNAPTPYQNAIRLLYILVSGAEKLEQGSSIEADGLFKGET